MYLDHLISPANEKGEKLSRSENFLSIVWVLFAGCLLILVKILIFVKI